MVFGLVLLAACKGRSGPVDVRVSLDGNLLEGIEIAVLPYDAMGILDSLEDEAESPRPHFAELEATLMAYEARDPAELSHVYAGWTAARDSVQTLADSLNRIGPGAPGYRQAYRRLSDLYGRLVREEMEFESASRQLTAEDRELATQAAEAADSLRRWERQTFSQYEAIASQALERSMRRVAAARTDDAGNGALTLEPGSWWLIARFPDPQNPFVEFFWNVPIVVNGFTDLVAPLSRRNVTLRWRH